MKRHPIASAIALLSMALVLAAPAQAKKKKEPSLLQAAAKELSDTLTPAPADDEACFAPVEKCDVKIAKFVSSARKSLDVAIFDINLDHLVHQILVQAKAIPVRILVDKRQAKGNHSLVPLLIKAGANVRFGRQRGIMHHKFVVVDGARLELGSFNYTNSAAFRNNENQLYLANPKIVERYRKRFEEMWAEADPAE